MVFWVKKIIVFLLIVSTITACLTSCKSKNIVDKESIFSVVDFEKGFINDKNFDLEYPRPQFQRDSYFPLNGVWEYAIKPSKSAFDCNVRLLLDEVNTSPVAYLLWNDFEDKESGTRYLKISNLSKCELRKYLDNAIIYPYIAVIIFTKDKIYVKSDGDSVFRRYLRTR